MRPEVTILSQRSGAGRVSRTGPRTGDEVQLHPPVPQSVVQLDEQRL